MIRRQCGSLLCANIFWIKFVFSYRLCFFTCMTVSVFIFYQNDLYLYWAWALDSVDQFLMQKLFWSKLVAARWLRGSNLANVIADQHERPLINIQNANIHKMQIFTKFQQLADNLFYPAVCLDELTIQTPVIPYRINSRFFVYFYLYLRSFVTVFVILCVQLCKDCW